MEPLKNRLDLTAVERVLARVRAGHPGFDAAACRADLEGMLEALELKGRLAAIADRVRAGLDADAGRAIAQVVAAAEAPGPALTGDFDGWVLCTVVERLALDAPEAALDAMPLLTRHATCEFAVRPLLLHHREATLARMARWAEDPHPAVRRLASEGSRPLLPWAPRVPALAADPGLAQPLLERLRDDPDEVVRRSVANHLNDVGKGHPEVLLAVAERWLAGASEARRRLVAHGLRTLVKKGDPRALAALGFTTGAEVAVEAFRCSDEVALGTAVELAASVRSTGREPQELVVDFVIHWLKAGGRVSPKVFKWKVATLAPGGTLSLTKRFPVRPATTRSYHPGRHKVVLQVAGEVVAEAHFTLSL